MAVKGKMSCRNRWGFCDRRTKIITKIIIFVRLSQKEVDE